MVVAALVATNPPTQGSVPVRDDRSAGRHPTEMPALCRAAGMRGQSLSASKGQD